MAAPAVPTVGPVAATVAAEAREVVRAAMAVGMTATAVPRAVVYSTTLHSVQH